MKVTKQQVENWNKKAGNGFSVNIRMLMLHSEKVLTKFVDIDEGHCYEYTIRFFEEYSNQGSGWRIETGRKIPMITRTKWKYEHNDMMSSSGWDKKIAIGEPVEKRSFALLQKLSHNITDEYLANM